jgi:lipopolysaccharide export system permease protein
MLIERYIFKQLLGPTILAVLALTGVAVLSRSLSALDVLVDQRQNPLVFLQITLLATPMLVSMILPVGLIVAALVALNRLQAEQELVIAFAGGVNRWRLVAPALELAAMAALIALAINLWVQPYSYRTMRDTLNTVRTDLVATVIRPGEFTHPSPGLTVYARQMSNDGDARDLFIYQRAAGTGASVVTAREGRIGRRNGAPVLILHQGSNQQFNRQGVLNYLSFDEYVLDLSPFMAVSATVRYKLSDRYMHELFFPDMRGSWEQQNRLRMLAEGHSRLASPLYNLTFMSMALAAVLGASFSRFGYGRRIAITAVLTVVVRIIGFSVQSAAAHAEWINALQYAVPIVAMIVALSVVFRLRLPAPGRRPAQGPSLSPASA